MQPDEILAELSSVTGTIPVAALHAATEHQAALTPPLLEALQEFCERTQNPLSTYDDQQTLADMAMYLLAQFREPRAFALYETLCRLPEDLSHYWLSDMLLQDFPSFLASTCQGRTEPLQRMAEDQQLFSYARWTALEALLTLVAQGAWSRADMIQWLCDLWPRWQAPEAIPDLTPLASVACDLAASELLPLARTAYAAGRIEWCDVDFADLEQRCELGEAASVDADYNRRHYVEDPARQMAWQARYAPERDTSGEEDYGDYGIIEPYVRPTPKIGRNDPCFCGSGKKYKKCCLNADVIGSTDFAVRQ